MESDRDLVQLPSSGEVAAAGIPNFSSRLLPCRLAPRSSGLPVVGSSRGQSDNHLQAVVTMAILPRFHVSAWGGPKPSMSDARYYHCYIVYKCRGTTEAPRAVEPGDALLADPATACLGFDAKRSQFTVSGAIPQDWD